MVEKCSLEIDALSSILFSFKNELDQFLHQVIITQSQRQNDIWTLLERAVIIIIMLIIRETFIHFYFCRLPCGSVRL